MVIPDAFNGSISDLHYYQGVIIAEVAVTLAVYIVLKIIHYVKWGAAEEQEAGPVEGAKKDVSAEEDTTTRVKYLLFRVEMGTKDLGRVLPHHLYQPYGWISPIIMLYSLRFCSHHRLYSLCCIFGPSYR